MDAALLPTKPQSYLQLIRLSLQLYKRGFASTFLLALILSILAFVPRLVFTYTGETQPAAPLSAEGLWILLVNLTCLVFFIAIIWRLYCVARALHEPLTQDFSIGLKKILYVFAAILLQTLLILMLILLIHGFHLLLKGYLIASLNQPGGALMATIVIFTEFFLALYVSTLFIFLIPLITIENRSILFAIETSVLLVWNHWWRTFSVQMTPWVCYVLTLLTIKIIFRINVHIYFFDYVSHPLWVTLLNLFMFALFIPWVAALMLVQMKDLEIRNKSLLPKELPWKRNKKTRQES